MHLPLATVLSGPDAQRTLDPGVQLYFGRQPFAEPATRFNLTTSDKNSNFLNKTDEDGCNWVFLSAVKGLQQAARKMGGNAVVNIVSIYKKEEIVSETHFSVQRGHVRRQRRAARRGRPIEVTIRTARAAARPAARRR